MFHFLLYLLTWQYLHNWFTNLNAMCRDVFTIWLGRSREMWRLRGSRGTPFSRSGGHAAWQEQTHLDRLEFRPDHGSIFIKAKFVYQPCLRSHHLLKAFEKPAWNELHPHSSCWNSLTLTITRGGPREITVTISVGSPLAKASSGSEHVSSMPAIPSLNES